MLMLTLCGISGATGQNKQTESLFVVVWGGGNLSKTCLPSGAFWVLTFWGVLGSRVDRDSEHRLRHVPLSPMRALRDVRY
eukprot:1362112-Rhodomonas_salina.1